MKVETTLTYKLEFTPTEFGLINRALRQTLKPEEVEAAKQLQQTLVEEKVKSFEHYARQINKLKLNLGMNTDT